MTSFDERYQRLSAPQRELLDRWFAEESGAASGMAAPYAAPATPAERTLAEVWQEVLEVPRVGVDDDYFSLGGDSIHAIVVVARSEAAGLQISTQDLFGARTIRRLAQQAEPVGAALGAAPQPPPAPDQEHPLSAMQQGMLFHAASARRLVYIVQVTCQLAGELDVPAFGRAWQAVVDRHQALRCGFQWPPGQPPRQRVAPSVTVPLEHQDWRAIPSPQQPVRLRQYLAADLGRRFDLERAPLLRLALFQTAESVHRFVWTHHHLLLDGWSQQLVLQDVLDAYAELRAGRPARVPARGWSAEYADRSAEPVPDDQDRFWREYLRGYTEPVRLPGEDEPAAPGEAAALGEVTATGPASVTVTLPEPTHAALAAFCRGHGLPLNTVLQGGWAMTLARFAGAGDVVFGATTSGRSVVAPGITEAVGMFINTLPVRARYQPTDRLLPWLRELHRRQVAAQRYEHTPLPRIVRGSDLAGGRPLFNTIMVVENFPTRLTDAHRAAQLRIEEPQAWVDEGYPLVVEVTPGPILTLRLRYDPGRVGRTGVEGLAGALRGFLVELSQWSGVADAAESAGDDGLSLAELSARVDAHQRRQAAADRAALHAVAAARLRGSQRTPVPAASAEPAEEERTCGA